LIVALLNAGPEQGPQKCIMWIGQMHCHFKADMQIQASAMIIHCVYLRVSKLTEACTNEWHRHWPNDTCTIWHVQCIEARFYQRPAGHASQLITASQAHFRPYTSTEPACAVQLSLLLLQPRTRMKRRHFSADHHTVHAWPTTHALLRRWTSIAVAEFAFDLQSQTSTINPKHQAGRRDLASQQRICSRSCCIWHHLSYQVH
jgi:hypothetical protein